MLFVKRGQGWWCWKLGQGVQGCQVACPTSPPAGPPCEPLNKGEPTPDATGACLSKPAESKSPSGKWPN